MRIIYLGIGFISLALAIVGVALPLLPTTPFLLLSIACFSKSSKRFEDWLYHTKLYQTYVADFRETKSIARERKKKIIVSIYILMGISIYFAPLLPVKIALGCLTVFITYYLFKVIPDKEYLKNKWFSLTKSRGCLKQYDIIISNKPSRSIKWFTNFVLKM